jgi:hypothetical protein
MWCFLAIRSQELSGNETSNYTAWN